MLKNENIICISSIDWDFIWQGHQEIMATFAKNNNRVLFIENTGVRAPTIKDLPRLKKRVKNWLKGVRGIRKEAENLFVFSPVVIPLPYSRIARWFNRRLILSTLKKWMEIVDFSDPIIWTFLPTGITLDIIDSLNKKSVVYYCIADFAKLVRNSKKIKRTEKQLLKKADVVFAQGAQLQDYCKRYNNNVSTFSFGVRFEAFEVQDVQSKEVPSDLKDIKHPIIGYIGGIHQHIDLELLERLAKENPAWSIVLIGPMQMNPGSLKDIGNIFFLEEKSHMDLPKYIGRFNVCLIPYVLSEYTRTVYPTKLNEYLAMGKPVVSTDLPEIATFNKHYNDIVMVGRNYQEFKDCIAKAIGEDDQSLRMKRIEVARENSWTKRIEQMSQIIEKAIKERQLDRYLMWKENLIDFYRTARRRLAKTVALCFLAYLLLFQSPFIWFLTTPLKISQAPAKADVIVVFGGGVGEGGSPGKSTIERARYAAELYKNGYANHVIFSSGYIYKYNDAENMKLFALSAGVSEKDIILEQKANSAYENAKFTKEILDDYNWSSILLVSSPYNMLRASLVFKKLDRNLKINYVPVIDPQFYYRERKVKWEQIKAIAHEYLGIIYYWWKGYI